MGKALDFKALGVRVCEQRKKKGWTQEQLAEFAGFTPTYISNIEDGLSKPRLSTLVQLANLLDTTVDGLLYDSLPVLTDQYDKEIKDLIAGCSRKEREFIVGLVRYAVENMRKI